MLAPPLPAPAAAPSDSVEATLRQEIKDLKETIRVQKNDRLHATARHGREIENLKETLAWQREETKTQTRAARKAAEEAAAPALDALEEKFRKKCEDAAQDAAKEEVRREREVMQRAESARSGELSREVDEAKKEATFTKARLKEVENLVKHSKTARKQEEEDAQRREALRECELKRLKEEPATEARDSVA